MRTFLLVSTLTAAVLCLTAFGPAVLTADNQPVETHDFMDQREQCLADCRSWLGDDFRRYGRGDYGRYRARMYARCVQKCERRYWKKFDEETKDLLDE